MYSGIKSTYRIITRLALGVALYGALWLFDGGMTSAATTITLYVSPTGSDSNPCTSSLPCKTINHALFIAAPGDGIHAEAGKYPEHLFINKNITIRGASLSSTVIDGGAAARVVDITSGASVTLAELTIQNGKETGVPGGGISNAGTLILKSVIVCDNSTTGGTSVNDNGGGIWNTGTLTVNSGYISGNHADNNGGGIYNQAGALAVENSLISGNTAGASGGGIESEAAATLTHTNVANNSAQSNGGGLDDSAGAMKLMNVTISGNSTTALAGAGGGIWQHSTIPITLTNVTFRNNSSPGGSGGGLFNQVNAILTDVTFDNNFAGNGGGMKNEGLANNATLTNVTFSGNGANLGGGLFNGGGIATLTNVTFSGNTGTAACAGGGSTICSLGGTVIFKNTIVANSISGGNCYNAGTFIDNGHNLDSGNTCGFTTANHDLINLDPLLGPLQNNGGYTDTLALLKGSPAINKGTNTGCPKTDQRGKTRITSTDPTCDIGAYEYP